MMSLALVTEKYHDVNHLHWSQKFDTYAILVPDIIYSRVQ